MPAVENGLGDIGGEEGEFEDAPDVALGKLLSVGDVPERFELSGDEPVDSGLGPDNAHRMAVKGIQFPWRWDSGTISTKLDVIWGMSVRSARTEY